MNGLSKSIILASLVTAAVSASAHSPAGPNSPVSKIIAARLAAMGHRNWIVVADAAYPLQTAPGIETITVDESQVDAVKDVLAALAKTKHVRPEIMLDAELNFVPESSTPGISNYRKQLQAALGKRPVTRTLHIDIIDQLDAAGKTFKILLIKTPHIMPYTSVFFRLNCGYWSDASEKSLRAAMAKGNN
jgi:L-fucose mutarotase/ribose pyranase (RbsD/FucU family)